MGFDLALSQAYNVEPVTQTLRRRLVRTTDDGRRGVLDARRRPSRLYFSHFATRTVDNTVDHLYAAKPDIRSESRFLPTPPAFDAPLGGFPLEYRHPVWHGKTRMAWLPDGEKNLKISLFILAQFTNVTDGGTDRHRMPTYAALMHRIARQK